MSSEERVVRPYLGVDRLQKALSGFSLRVGNDVLDNGQRLMLSPLDYLSRTVAVALAGDGAPLAAVREQLVDGIDELGIERGDVELLIVLSTPRLKLSEIVWRRRLDEAHSLEPTVVIASGLERPLALQTPFGGCRVDVYLALSSPLDQVILRPWRKGTWIGHVAFVLSTDLGEIGFTPLPLDDETRSLLNVPKSTNRVVRIQESVLNPDVTDDALELYVDADLLATLAHFPSTAGARSFQRQLFLDAATAIVVEALRSPELGDRGAEELEGSLLGKVISLVAGRRAGELEQARRGRREQVLGTLRNDPTLFIALLEAECSTKIDLSTSLMAGAGV